MRPIVLSQTGTGSSAVAPLDQYVAPVNVALGCVVTGTVNYTVQHTYDDPFAATFDPTTATWFNHQTLASKTANAESNYAYPPRAVRVTVNSGTGSVTVTIVQAGVR